jgi:hypothetical protein
VLSSADTLLVAAAAAAAAAARFIDGYTLRNYTLKGLILQVRKLQTLGCIAGHMCLLCLPGLEVWPRQWLNSWLGFANVSSFGLARLTAMHLQCMLCLQGSHPAGAQTCSCAEPIGQVLAKAYCGGLSHLEVWAVAAQWFGPGLGLACELLLRLQLLQETH